MTPAQLEFSAREGAQLFPVALNTLQGTIDPGQLLPYEVVTNIDVLRTPSGELTTHPKWGRSDIASCIKVLTFHVVDIANIAKQIVFFGYYENAGLIIGFIGRIMAENILKGNLNYDLLVDNLNQYIIPVFVAYRKGVYIFLGHQGVKYFNGTNVVATSLPKAAVGCSVRQRLFLGGIESDPGVVKFTEINEETINANNVIVPDDAGELVTAVWAYRNSVLITKKRKIYEYEWTEDIYNGSLTTHSKKAGCSYHTLIQQDFDEVFCTNEKGVYILNPQQARLQGKHLVVDPRVIDISPPVINEIKNLHHVNVEYGVDKDDYFQTGDFDEYQDLNITIGYPIKLTEGTPVLNQAQNFHNVNFELNHIYKYRQTFKVSSTRKFDKLRLYGYRRAWSNLFDNALRVKLREDDGGNPGGTLKTIYVPVSAITQGSLNWINIQGWDVTLEEGEIYWIEIEKMSDVENLEIRLSIWSWEFDFYPNGKATSNDPAFPTEGGSPYNYVDFRFQVYLVAYKSSGYCIYKKMGAGNINEWLRFVSSHATPAGTTLTFYVKDYYDTTWYEITSGSDIPDELKKVQYIHWKAVFTSDGRHTPTLSMVQIDYYKVDGKLMGSGMRDRRYYIFAKDRNDNDLNLAYGIDGWLQVDCSEDLFEYCVCNDDEKLNDVKIFGAGRAGISSKGCLFYAHEPDDSEYLDMPIHIKTGRLLLDDVPKKGRTIFIVYQGESVVLKLHTAAETKTFNLDDATTGFAVSELNFGTARCKYFELEILADAKFKLKSLGFNFKVFKPNEV